MTDEDHEELLDALLEHQGSVLLSGYDSPLYNDRLKGWHREEAVSYTQTVKKRIEVLWMNFEPECRQSSMWGPDGISLREGHAGCEDAAGTGDGEEAEKGDTASAADKETQGR